MKLALLLAAPLALSAAEVRLTNDNSAYISVYTLATGSAYTDPVLQECSVARGRQNEPTVVVDPRDTRVLVGSSNDYCGVYAGSPAGSFVPNGPIWLGYYRSEDAGRSFVSSLVPGYPGDVSPYAALAAIRTASAGDPVAAWDGHGRLYMGAESSEDPAGTKKGFGDVWVARFDNPGGASGNTLNDGKRYLGASIVARGSSSPATGKFNDKTALEADRSGGACDSNVYFAWSRFTGPSVSNIYFARSTDHGQTWSSPLLLTSSTSNVQDPEIAVTGNGHVYVTFDHGATNSRPAGIGLVKSTDCGATFGKSALIVQYTPYTAQDAASPQPIPSPASAQEAPLDEGKRTAGALNSDCGDFADACQSGYTFFRRDTITRSRADQFDPAHEYIYITYEASKPGTETPTGTTYGSIRPGTGSQSGAYFVRYDGAAGIATTPKLIDPQNKGHQFFTAISADGGVLHALWWDSRNDPSYSPMRPVGNDAAGKVHPSLDVYASSSTDGGATWTRAVRLTSVTSNPNFEQFDDRSVPFAGDYLWVTSYGSFAFGAWTDWRNTVAGPDPREPGATDGADVKQCRTFDASTGVWNGDQCPHAGGLDQDIYGSRTP